MAEHHHHLTAPEDRIPLREKIGFTLGGVGMGATNHMVFGAFFPTFNMILGVSPALLSTVGFIQSIIASVLDPFLGQFSDNFRSRWGRRRLPIMLFAAPLALGGAALYWFPSGASENYLFYWLLIILPLITLVNSCYGLPFSALRIEATTDYHERVRLGVFTGLLGGIVGIGYQWINPLIMQPFFGTPLNGLRWVSGVLAIAAFFLLLAPVFLCPEKRYAKQTSRLKRLPLLKNIPEMARNKPFLVIASIKFFTFFCYTTVGALGAYMNTYFIFGGDLKKAALTSGILGTTYVIAGLVSLPIYQALAVRLGKRHAMRIAAGILMTGCTLKLVIYDPHHPLWQIAVLICNGASTAGLHMITGAMFGDIIDYDEWCYGQRREALFGSFFGLSEKMGDTFGGLVSGFVLVAIGFHAKAGIQTGQTLHLMQLCYFALPFLGALFAFVAIGFYSISEDKAYDIKAELKRRNDAKAAAEQASPEITASVA